LKILFALLVCLSASVGVLAQAETKTPDEIGVETISLARDDGSGKPGDVIDGFLTKDVPIHCLIDLTSSQTVTVKMNLVAVKAAGIKAGANVVAVSYKTSCEIPLEEWKELPCGDAENHVYYLYGASKKAI